MYLFSESSIDFKYKIIYKNIDGLKPFTGTFISFLKFLFNTGVRQENLIYHIRYIKWNGYIGSVLRYLGIIFLSKVFKFKIIFSLHNIFSHNYKSKFVNKIVNSALFLFSTKVIIFHQSLQKYTPKYSHKKIMVSNFGSLNEYVNSFKTKNENFVNEYEFWKNKNKLEHPVIISISTAKKNKLNTLIEYSLKLKIFSLVIAPNVKIDDNLLNDYVFFYNREFVRNEISDLLKKPVIGFIGHDNFSVPTSLYMFASFKLPIIAYEIEPLKSILDEYRIGEVFKDLEDFEGAKNKISNNYNYYSNNCIAFLKENSWENAIAKHKTLFEELNFTKLN